MTVIDETRSKKLRQVQALLNKADDKGSTPEEADALRKKADDLMLAYTIEQWELDQHKPVNQRQHPERRRMDVCPDSNPIKDHLIDLMSVLSKHVRCRAVYHTGTSMITASVFGMSSDLDYLEMLFTSLHVQMANNLEPKPDPLLSEAENLAAMKEAGMKWERIHSLMYPGVPWERRHGVRYTKVYTDFCKDRGRERLYVSPQTFVRNYTEAFVAEVSRRLYEIRKLQEQETTGMDLVLRDITSDVNKMVADAFPKLGRLPVKKGKFDASAARRGRDAGSRADLGQRGMDKRREIT